MTEGLSLPEWERGKPDYDQMGFELDDPQTYNFPILGDITVATEPKFDVYYLNDINDFSGHSKRRRISSPNEAMRQIHHQFIGNLRWLHFENPYATGGLPRTSPYKNVQVHAGNRYFYQVDIQSAYEQVEAVSLAMILAEVAHLDREQTDQMITFLEKFCIDPRRGGLFTGAPSSPDLFNLYMWPVDQLLGELAEEYGLTYSRYIDDLTFSAPDKGHQQIDQITRRKRAGIRQILSDVGLPISHEKSRNDDIQNGPVTITGVQLNPNGVWQLPTHGLRQILRMQTEWEQLQEASDDRFPDEVIAKIGGYNGLLRASTNMKLTRLTDDERRALTRFNRLFDTDWSRRDPDNTL